MRVLLVNAARLALAIAVGACYGLVGPSCGTSDRVHKAPPSTVAHVGSKHAPAIEEDEPGWDCVTMGNGQCGSPEGYE